MPRNKPSYTIAKPSLENGGTSEPAKTVSLAGKNAKWITSKSRRTGVEQLANSVERFIGLAAFQDESIKQAVELVGEAELADVSLNFGDTGFKLTVLINRVEGEQKPQEESK